MLEAFGNIDDRHLGNQQIHSLVDPAHYLGWPNETMIEWVYPCKYAPRGHFLDDGHRKVAEKIYEHIRHLSWVA